MLQPHAIHPLWITLIKVLSPILIMGALVIDATIASQWMQGQTPTKMLIALGAVGSVALSAHILEGILASAMAYKRGLNPLKYGIYTFFVGTVAFIDLMDLGDKS